MKIICNAKELSSLAQNVQRAAASKSSIPAIEGILLKAKNGKLHLTGYDLELGIQTSIDARVEQEGSIILVARYFCDILRKLPDEQVIIESDARLLCHIRSGQANYALNGMSPDEYPELPNVSGIESIDLPQDLFREMVRQTIFAVSESESKRVHNGVKFEIENKLLRMIAVDGFRLAVRSEAIDYEGDNYHFIVPAKTLSEITKLISDDEKQLSIAAGKHHIVFQINGYTIVSRLIDGEFLDYKTAIPKTFKTDVNVNTKDFIDSIERTSLLITDRLKSPVRCIFQENAIRISSVTANGKANDRISAQVEGERIEIGFNNRFLLDALRVCDTDEVKLHLVNAVSPLIILPPEGNSFLFLILPVRLKNEA